MRGIRLHQPPEPHHPFSPQGSSVTQPGTKEAAVLCPHQLAYTSCSQRGPLSPGPTSKATQQWGQSQLLTLTLGQPSTSSAMTCEACSPHPLVFSPACHAPSLSFPDATLPDVRTIFSVGGKCQVEVFQGVISTAPHKGRAQKCSFNQSSSTRGCRERGHRAHYIHSSTESRGDSRPAPPRASLPSPKSLG